MTSMTSENPILKSMEEAEALRQTLVDDLMRIQLELSNKDVRTWSGQRKDGISYHQWRQERLQTLAEVTGRLRYVKGWIRVHSRLPGEKPKTKKTRVAALELLYRRIKSYSTYNSERGSDWNLEEADQRWNDIVSAMNEVEKADESPETGGNPVGPSSEGRREGQP